MAGAAVITAVMMASCSDVVDIPQHDPYASNGAPVIEAIYDAQDASATPQVITGGVLNQMIKIKGKNLSHVKSISFNGCLLYTSPSPRDRTRSRMPSSA